MNDITQFKIITWDAKKAHRPLQRGKDNLKHPKQHNEN